MTKKKNKSRKNERIINGILAAVVIFSILILGYSIKSLFLTEDSNRLTSQTSTNQAPAIGRMSFTSFDKELARGFMDKNNDGKCDSCGMPVDMCIDSGQMQCNMDSKSTIGDLGSQHIHADWKIYINGQQLDFTGKDHMTRMKSGSSVSSFIHVDSGAPAPEKTGDVIHMHAKGIPLWIFFESLGMKFNNDCLVLDTGEKYCNNKEKSLKFYVNSQSNNQYENYVFNDLDKILISYGDETEEEIQQQLSAITDYAKSH
ncbi:hypothetical protein HYU23_04520 [Candidatus Woesearchaeota archaeon]|nr:hypothetical protein [Candidatus Woesearchaeota archaeon]